MSETSVWVTGESGSIYERFWNGLQWVIAPHGLPVSAGYAVSVFIVNQTILALSEAGYLYQLTEDSQPIWVELTPDFDKSTSKETVQLSSGVISNDRERMYFSTKNGLLLELLGNDPPSWTNHGRPPGANVSAITDASMIKPGLLFIVSVAGDLYEYDQTSKPTWKKHIHREGSTKDTSLASFRACSLHGLVGPNSVSLFLLTKGGELIERRLHQRKWKWFVHGNPKGHPLTSITCISQDEPNENSNSLFVTTAAGFVFQYHIRKYPDQDDEENWLNHNHPPHARAARGIAGLQLQFGRIIFPLDDGRLAELHLSGLGGESLGPNAPLSTRRKSSLKYVWSFLDAPETEGWNAEYCTEERGPSNCILGTKDEVSISRWRKDSKTQHNYLTPSVLETSLSGLGQDYDVPNKRSDKFFRLRLMQEGKSFFLITDNDMTFEYLNTENAWFWLRHEHSTGIGGALGNYNGSLFLVDVHGSLLIRERSSSDLAWINCTGLRKGKQVIGGPPWDGTPGREPRARPEDAIFFVSRSSTEKVQMERLQKSSGHENRENRHETVGIITQGLSFMLSEDGGLVEYQWSSTDGWNWIEHGQPRTNVTLVGAPGPCFRGSELFLIGSDGNVYIRYLDQGEWKWGDCGFPYVAQKVDDGERQVAEKAGNGEICVDKGLAAGFEKIEEKNSTESLLHFMLKNGQVSSTRPIPFSEDSVIFELQDGRLAEMRRVDRTGYGRVQ
ncbi:hypothetical protein DH2020_020881 [Rehmannia glutinosa]|uniref:Fucose-specific lectin n=1 Tax=Rehmannia glutinosa TaxID=99300 RepID=A0ABR0WBS5_REHGL